MALAEQRRYRAFISYSHRDGQWGKWLQNVLEGYRIPKDMIGRETAVGTVPDSLRPIFRDRLDLSAGPSLEEQLQAALEASENLIVICSPSSSASEYVNEEVRRFKALGRADRILALIVDGSPGDPENQCFPEALRFEVDDNGEITDQPLEPVGADVRASADGKLLAKLKIISGLLGVNLDDLRRREEIAERRRKRVLFGVAASMAVLAVMATVSAFFAYQQLERNARLLDRTLETATDMVNNAVRFSAREGIPASLPLSVLEQAETLFKDLEQLGGDHPQLRFREAIMLIRFAQSYGILGNTTVREQHLRRAVKLLSASIEKTGELPELMNLLAWAHSEFGLVHRTKGEFPAAAAEINKGLAIRQDLVDRDPKNATWLRSLSNSRNLLGNVLRDQGDLVGALSAYQTALDIKKPLFEGDRDNLELKYELAKAYMSIGRVHRDSGQPDAALSAFNAGLELQQALVGGDPGNVNWQRDLSVAQELIGDLHMTERNFEDAEAAYSAGFRIRRRLASADRTNQAHQSDLAYSYTKIGSLHLRRGKPEDALTAQNQALEIRRELHQADQNNAEWARDLGLSHRLVGDVLAQMQRIDEALASYASQRTILERLLANDETKVDWRRDLASNHIVMANLLLGKKDLEGAVDAFQRASNLFKRLTELAPDMAIVHREYFTIQRSSARVLRSLKRHGEAVAAYEIALQIARGQLKTDAADTYWQTKVAQALEGIGKIKQGLSDLEGASAAYDQSLQIRRQLATAAPDSAKSAGNLALSYFRAGKMYAEQGRTAEALELFNSGLELARKLKAREPEQKRWQIILTAIETEIVNLEPEASTQ